MTVVRTRNAEQSRWHWRGPVAAVSRFELDMVRAEVWVGRSRSGTIEVEAVSVGDPDQAEMVQIKLETSPSGLRLFDLFPPRPTGWIPDECLPPVGEHGDFWRNTTRFRVTLRLPPGVQVSGRIMDGRLIDRRPGTTVAVQRTR